MTIPLNVSGGLSPWHALVTEAEQRCHRSLGELLESYLIFALMRHLRDQPLLGRIVALEWLSACERQGVERCDALRDVGDHCLLITGLYPKHAQRRRVDTHYYVQLGQSAYAGAADASRDGMAQLYEQLAKGFGELVTVLRALRQSSERSFSELPSLPVASPFAGSLIS